MYKRNRGGARGAAHERPTCTTGLPRLQCLVPSWALKTVFAGRTTPSYSVLTVALRPPIALDSFASGGVRGLFRQRSPPRPFAAPHAKGVCHIFCTWRSSSRPPCFTPKTRSTASLLACVRATKHDWPHASPDPCAKARKMMGRGEGESRSISADKIGKTTQLASHNPLLGHWRPFGGISKMSTIVFGGYVRS